MENWDLEKDNSSSNPNNAGNWSDVDIEQSEGSAVSQKQDDLSLDDVSQHGRRASSIVEWKAPTEPIETGRRLSLAVDSSEIEVFAEEVRDKQHTLLDKGCVAEDVIRVWNYISKFISQQLKEGYGVQIPGLCTITYQIEKYDLEEAPDYFELVKTPLMIMSPRVVKMYKLRNDEPVHVGMVKSVPLNLTKVASMSKVPRPIVEGALTELLQAFARAVVCDKKIEFPFPSIGKLQVQHRKATMKFYEEFYRNAGFNLPELYLHPLNSASTENDDDAESTAADRVIPGRMTPLRKHIPTEKYRSVFHLREVRSVHDGDLLVEPADLEEEIKCDHRRNTKTKYSLAENVHRDHDTQKYRKSNVSAHTDDSFNDDDKLNYTWNPMKKHWVDNCGHPVEYFADPLYKIPVTGKYKIDVVSTSTPHLMDALFTHHHNVCAKVLGVHEVAKHYARRDKVYVAPLSYEDMHFNPPSP